MTRLQIVKSNIAQFEQISKELARLQRSVLGYERYKLRRDYFLSDMVKGDYYFHIDKYMKSKVYVGYKLVNACIGTIYRESDFAKVLEKLESLKKEIEKCRE